MSEPISKFKDVEIYDGKTLADVFKEIHQNTKDKADQIDILINQLSPLIKNVSDAVQLIPYIKDYLSVSVTNNEHLVKMAAIVQRSIPAEKITKTSSGGIMADEYNIPPEEIEQLKQLAMETNNTVVSGSNPVQ